jgi:hypothetical protein
MSDKPFMSKSAKDLVIEPIEGTNDDQKILIDQTENVNEGLEDDEDMEREDS